MPKHKDYYLRVQSAALFFQKKLALQSGALLTTRNPNRGINSATALAAPTNDYLRAISVKEKNRSILKKCLKEKDRNSINIENNNCEIVKLKNVKLSNPVVSSREMAGPNGTAGKWESIDLNNNEVTCVTEIGSVSGKF